MLLANEIFKTQEHMITNQNQWKNSDQVSCKLSSFNWKRKMDETNWSSDFYLH